MTTGAKIAVAVVVIGAAYVGYKMYKKSKDAKSPSGATVKTDGK